jgi:hypothetical protein
MTSTIKIKRGSDSRRQNYVLQEGELLWTPDLKELWIGDGMTSGGLKITAGIGNSFIPNSEKAQAGGVATLDINGKISSNQLPAIAITDVFTANTDAEMIALPAQSGDVAIRPDINKTFIHSASTTGTLSDWVVLSQATGGVSSINNKTGVVSLVFTDLLDTNIINQSIGDIIQWDGTKWINATQTFLSDTDTPTTFNTHANKLVAVNSTETALEFIDLIDSGLYLSTQEPQYNTVI